GASRRKYTPSTIVLGLGIGFAIFTLASGVSSWFWPREDHSTVTHEAFGGIPEAVFWAFYIVVPVLIIVGAVMFSNRTRNWQRGRPDNRATTAKNAKRRVRDFGAGVYMQTLMRDPAAGIMHSLIYFSFLIPLGVTTVLEVDHQFPSGLKFLHGGVYH